MNAGAIRAGLAVVELSADQGPLLAALNSSAAALKGWVGKLGRLGAGIGGVGLSIAGPIMGAFHQAVEGAAKMDTLATQLGLTTEKASALSYALGTVGIEEAELIGFSRHLSNAFSSAADGSHEAVEQFTKLRLNWQELAKMPLDEQLLAVKDAIGQVTTAFDRSNQASHFFGRRGQELLKLSGDDIRKRMGEAGDVGAIISPEQAAQAKEIQRSFGQMGAAMKYAFVEVGRALLPHAAEIKEYSKTVVNVARSVRVWVSDNKPLVTGVLAAGAALTAAGVALVALGVVGGSVTGIITGLAAAFGVLSTVVGGAVTFLASPVGLALAAVAVVVGALGAAYAYMSEEQRKAFATGPGLALLQRVWPEVKAEGVKAWGVIREAGVEAWGGIVSAMKRGDLQSAWAILQAGFDVTWQQVKASANSVWLSMRDDFLDHWDFALAVLKSMFTELGEAMVKPFRPVISVVTTIANVIGTAMALLNAMVTTVTARIGALASRLGGTALVRRLGLGGELKEFGDAASSAVSDKQEDYLQRHQRQAREAVEEARKARAEASAEEREQGDQNVKAARERLRELLEEEKKKAAAAGKAGAGGGGGKIGDVQAAAREVRGSFAVGAGAQAQQQFTVGSSPWQRQIIDQGTTTNNLLEQIRDKVEGPPVFA